LEAWYRPARAEANPNLDLTAQEARRPELLGSWNGWKRPGLLRWEKRVTRDGTEWRRAVMNLPPGTYEYGIRLGQHFVLDETNPQSTFVTDPLASPESEPVTYGVEVSRIEVEDCSKPVLYVDALQTVGSGLELRAGLQPGREGGALDPASLQWELRRGREQLPAGSLQLTTEGDLITLRAAGLAPGKYTLALEGADREGRRAARTTVSAFVEADGGEGVRPLGDGLVYQLIVDRFRNENGALAPPDLPGDRAGGDLAGVQAAIEAGYFERMGVTTLWLSPLYQNPAGRRLGRDGRLYEAYHGYWPSEPRSVETRFGGEAALDSLIAAAHARGVRIVADAVPNHVYESHPYYLAHSRLASDVSASPDPTAASWFNDGPSKCICGYSPCGWDQTCWFDRYLPDFNWQNPALEDIGAEDLVWWTNRFDLDGLRIDAVPLMPRAATRLINRRVRQSVRRFGLDGLLIGETYTGPGDLGRSEIRAYLGLNFDGLDSQFDFPLMWATRSAFAFDQLGLDDLEGEVEAGDRAWAGSGATIAHIIGNHDTTRFISEAAGDANVDPWLEPPPQPTVDGPYLRHFLAMTFMLTLPGLPVIYQGDEVALAGAGDPDCRRVMPDVLGTLPPRQAAMLDNVSRLGRLRRCLPALRRGTRQVLYKDRDHLIALLQPPAGASGGPALVVLAHGRAQGAIPIPGIPAGRYRDALSDTRIEASSTTSTVLNVAPWTAAVFLEETSPCHE
jgi:glycosidase